MAEAIREIAHDHRTAIVFELHEGQTELGAGMSDIVACRPFTYGECMHASGHLLANRGIIGPNTEAALAVSGGNPWKLRRAMTEYFLSGRHSRGEPLDFARSSGHEQVRISTAGNGGRRSGENPGALDECRSRTRNSSTGSADVYMRLWGYRSSVCQLLREYRRCKKRQEVPTIALCRSISELFADLGSMRRQTRWSQKGLASYSWSPGRQADEDQLTDFIVLLGRGSSPEETIDRLGSLKNGEDGLSKRLRGLVRSEMGAAYLHSRRPGEAQTVLHEAMALCLGRDGYPEHEAVILNRLGTAKMLLQDYAPARQYLLQASRSARRIGDWPTLRRIEGNLGLLSLYCAEPETALQWFRRHRDGVIRARRYSEYLSTLLNETNCHIDLGKGLAAERRSRLAVSLAETLSDDMRLAYAQNNLGWIMTMRCKGRIAKDCLATALVIRENIGDKEGMAQTRLNFARLHLLARNYDQASELIKQSCGHFESLGSQEGVWDCHRLLAKRALCLEEYEEAASELDLVLSRADELPRKDHVDALLLNLERSLWSGEVGDAAQILEAIDAIPAASRIHTLRARRTLLAGLFALCQQDVDSAHAQCSTAAQMFRESNREDLLLEALTVMALLADRMGHTAAGLRYLGYVESTTARLREEIS
jgi:tetratricopeptide (TPR) repeat protein